LIQHCNTDYPTLLPHLKSPKVPDSELSKLFLLPFPNHSENFHPEGLS
jgi:hypothetical protein